jgi:hypothetical protein
VVIQLPAAALDTLSLDLFGSSGDENTWLTPTVPRLYWEMFKNPSLDPEQILTMLDKEG